MDGAICRSLLVAAAALVLVATWGRDRAVHVDPPEPLATTDGGYNTAMYYEAGMSHLSADKFKDEDLAPLTKAAQRLIYEHQHPANGCAGRKFAVSRSISGLGSMIHIATYHLAVALEEGRIFVWHEQSAAGYTDPTTCGEIANFNCFFLPVSNCTLADARASGADIMPLNGGALITGFPASSVPTEFKVLFEQLGAVPPEQSLKSWCRGQAAAYLMRFNGAMLGRIRDLRLRRRDLLFAAPLGGRHLGHHRQEYYPLPRGMTSIHVRHGDKGSEMRLVPARDYFLAAEKLVAQRYPDRLLRAAFVSTEDPDVIEEAKAVAGGNEQLPGLGGWTWVWYNVTRFNSNGDDQLARVGLPRG